MLRQSKHPKHWKWRPKCTPASFFLRTDHSHRGISHKNRRSGLVPPCIEHLNRYLQFALESNLGPYYPLVCCMKTITPAQYHVVFGAWFYIQSTPRAPRRFLVSFHKTPRIERALEEQAPRTFKTTYNVQSCFGWCIRNSGLAPHCNLHINRYLRVVIPWYVAWQHGIANPQQLQPRTCHPLPVLHVKQYSS